MRPRARHRDLVIQEVEGELLVYDRQTQRAHCLSPVAVAVWRTCNGKRSIEELERAASRVAGHAIDGRTVKSALAELSKAKLLDGPAAPPSPSRRRILGALVAAPAVITILTPTPAQAASCSGLGKPCGTNGKACCPGLGLTCICPSPGAACKCR